MKIEMRVIGSAGRFSSGGGRAEAIWLIELEANRLAAALLGGES
jgi:hypothetical protein